MIDFTENDDEAFLSELPVDIIIDSIKRQFDKPEDGKKRDYVDLYFKRYRQIKENSLDDDNILLDEERDSFISTLSELLEDHLHIGLNVLDDTSDEEEIENVLIMAFRFFVCKIRKNFTNVIYNYIENNKEDLVKEYGKNKDVTTSSFKNDITDKTILIVLSNVGYIVDDVIEKLRKMTDVDEFFELCQGNKVYVELEYIKDCFEEMKLTGNFIQAYFDKLDDDKINEIETKVRQRIIKKHKK